MAMVFAIVAVAAEGLLLSTLSAAHLHLRGPFFDLDTTREADRALGQFLETLDSSHATAKCSRIGDVHAPVADAISPPGFFHVVADRASAANGRDRSASWAGSAPLWAGRRELKVGHRGPASSRTGHECGRGECDRTGDARTHGRYYGGGRRDAQQHFADRLDAFPDTRQETRVTGVAVGLVIAHRASVIAHWPPACLALRSMMLLEIGSTESEWELSGSGTMASPFSF